MVHSGLIRNAASGPLRLEPLPLPLKSRWPSGTGRARCGPIPLLPKVAAAAVAALLAGCATLVTPPRSNDLVPATDALIDLPVGGPEIVAVVDQSGPLQLSQRILLGTSTNTYGQNSFEIRAAKVSQDVGVEGTGTVLGVTPQIISRELRGLFPTIPMAVSELFVQNDYGPFGYATGRAESGDTCLYAWQVIRGSTTLQAQNSGGIVAIRLRLCDSRASADDLLAVMYGFTLKAAVPITPPLLRPEIGRTAAPVYGVPLGTPPPAAATTIVGRPPPPRPIRPPVPAVPVAPLPVTPLPGYPAVPLPPGAQTGLPVPAVPLPAGTPNGIIVPLPPD